MVSMFLNGLVRLCLLMDFQRTSMALVVEPINHPLYQRSILGIQ